MNGAPGRALPVLRACLATRADPRPGDWSALGDLREVLQLPAVRQAGLLAQLLHAAGLAGVELDPALRSRLRAARAHEELRLEATAQACREALAADVVVLRGVALAHTVYDEPALRHCHDIDLLVPAGAGVTRHASGFPVARHTSLLRHRRIGVEDVATVDAMIAGVAARVLDASGALVHVCAHAASGGAAHSPLWAIDAGLLIRRGPDWDQVVERAREWRCARVTGSALGWLQRDLGVAVPGEVVRELRTLRLLRRRPAARH